MKRSTKLFLGYVALLFAITFFAMLWGKNRLQNELDTVLEQKDILSTLSIENDTIRGINIDGPFDITLHNGKGAATISGPKIMVDDFALKVRNGLLTFSSRRFVVPKGVRLSLDVYAKSFEEMYAHGKTIISSTDTLRLSHDCKIKLRDKAQMKLVIYPVNILDVSIESDGNQQLSGDVGQLEVYADDDAFCDFSQLPARIVKVFTAEDAKVIVNATEKLSLTATDDSNISYIDNAAEVSKETNDDATITSIAPDTEVKKPVQ